MIPQAFIEELCRRCDIEEVIGQYVTLKRAGSNKNGLCPFHSEKTPSFTVFPATASFYCFGCGAGGNVITFIQKIENLDYVGAIEALAARVGLTVPQERDPLRGGARPAVTRQRVYEMNLEAAKFFREQLFDPEKGKAGMAYFAGKRRLSSAVIKHFGLGYAPNDFGALRDHMRAKGYTDEELVAAFLCARSQKGTGIYDIFRHRVMFPVIDTTGNIVAFGGRVLDDSKPKYINTSDTPGFKKSRTLFGLNYARYHCAEQMILCEGYMDTIAMHAAGFENAVATLGTAITPDHARLLARYTKRVIINYDSDEAGQKAAEKAMKLLDEVGLEVRVLKIVGAKDADELIRTNGAQAFRAMLGESRTAFDFKMESVLAAHDPATMDGKIRAARELTAIIAETPSVVERELYIGAAAKRLGVSAESMKNEVARRLAQNRRAAAQKRSRDLQAAAHGFGDRINPDAAKNPAAAAAEETVLGLLLLYPEHRAALVSGKVALEAQDFFTSFGRRAFETILQAEQSDEGFSFDALGAFFSPDEMGRLVAYRRAREELANNGEAVLSAAAAALRAAREKQQTRDSGSLTDEIARRRAQLKEKTEK